MSEPHTSGLNCGFFIYIFHISLIRRCGYFFFFLFFIAVYFVWLLFEGGDYFIGKLADSNDGWIRCMWPIQLGLIDTGSSMCSLSVLLSAMGTTLRKCTALEIAQWAPAGIICTHARALRILAVATIQGWYLFCSELPIVRWLFKGSDYLRAASNISIKEVWCIPVVHIPYYTS